MITNQGPCLCCCRQGTWRGPGTAPCSYGWSSAARTRHRCPMHPLRPHPTLHPGQAAAGPFLHQHPCMPFPNNHSNHSKRRKTPGTQSTHVIWQGSICCQCRHQGHTSGCMGKRRAERSGVKGHLGCAGCCSRQSAPLAASQSAPSAASQSRCPAARCPAARSLTEVQHG